MAISKARILDAAVLAITDAGKYVDGDGDPLTGSALTDAQAATRTGLEFIVGPLIDELVLNAVVSTTVAGSAATNALPVNGVPEVVGNAAVTGTGSGGLS